MAIPARAAQSIHGPQASNGAWMDQGVPIQIAAASNTAPTGTLFSGQIVPTVIPYTPGDNLASGSPIMRLFGAQIVFAAAVPTGGHAAQTALAIGIGLYRANAWVGGAPAFGYAYTGGTGILAGGAGTPDFGATAYTALVLPSWLSTNTTPNTALTTNQAGQSYIPAQPGDLLIVVVGAQTGTISLPAMTVNPLLV